MSDSIATLASPLIGSSIGMTFPNSFLSISIWIILASSLIDIPSIETSVNLYPIAIIRSVSDIILLAYSGVNSPALPIDKW